jgi:hypothetical protein
MKIQNIIEGKSENRELWDRIKSKGVVPGFDKEKYQARDGLEGPFRLRNGKVVYYDPQEGSYYDPDTDLYISYDDYKKMDEDADLPNKKPAGYYVMRNGQSISYHQDKESAEKRARTANMRGGSNATVVKDDRGVKEEADLDSYADALIKRNKQNLNKGHVVNAARIAGVDEKQLMAAVNKKVGRIKEEADLDKDVSAQIAELIRKKNSMSSPIARKNIDSQIALLKKKRGLPEGYYSVRSNSLKQELENNGWERIPAQEVPDHAKYGYRKNGVGSFYKVIDEPYHSFDASFVKPRRVNALIPLDTLLQLIRGSSVTESDKRPKYVVTTKDKPKIVKPSMGGESPHPYQGKLVGATESSQWGEPEDVLRQVLQTLEREVEWPLTDVMDPQQVKQLLSPLMQAVSQHLNSLDEAEVSNTDYEFTHGKKPGGQGSWFFVAHRGGINFSKDVEGEDYVELHGMSYGDAKKAAVKWAKSKGHTSLFVAT